MGFVTRHRVLVTQPSQANQSRRKSKRKFAHFRKSAEKLPIVIASDGPWISAMTAYSLSLLRYNSKVSARLPLALHRFRAVPVLAVGFNLFVWLF